MAKSSRKRRSARAGEMEKAVQQTKKQIARSRREARQNRIIWLSVGALASVILLIVVIGVVQEVIIKPGSPVAIVNGTKIRMDDYHDLLTYRRYNLHLNQRNLQSSLDTIDPSQEGNEFLISFYEQQLGQLQSALALAPEDTLDELIEGKLIQEKAEELGITVTADDVEQLINEDLQRAASPSPQEPISDTEELPTPVPQEQLDTIYQGVLDSMGLTDRAFRNIIQRGLLREKVQESLASQVPTTGLVAHVQMIQASTEEEALSAKERIEGGEDFAIVAQEVSTGTLLAENDGDLGWVTTGQLSERYGENVENLAFSSEVGTIGVVESNGQFCVILVLERDENGPLPEQVLTLRQNSALADWLEQRKASPDVEIERLLEAGQIPEDPFATQP